MYYIYADYDTEYVYKLYKYLQNEIRKKLINCTKQ